MFEDRFSLSPVLLSYLYVFRSPRSNQGIEARNMLTRNAIIAADCVNVVRNLPVCANSTWDMYALKNGDGFCCEPDQYDVLPLNGYAGICEPLDVAVAASLVATPASQVGGAAIVTQTRVGGTDATGTITVTSSLANGGGMTTVTTAASATKNTPATTTSLAPGTLPSPSGGATATITLTKGAEIGVAVGAGVFAIIAGLLIWRCLRNRKRRKIAGAGAAPAYSSIPPAGHNGRPVEVGSPGTEYKSPAVGLFPSQFGGAGRAGSDGFVSPNTPPVGHQQVLYGGVGGGQGNVNERYEVPGESRPTMVEAPNTWERGL